MLFAKLINFTVIIETGILASMEVLMVEVDVGINNFFDEKLYKFSNRKVSNCQKKEG